MIKDNLIQEALYIIDEISNNPDIYMSGVLLNDLEAKNHIATLAHVQAIIMQSMQVNNQKRAIKYIAAFKKLLKTNVSLADRLKASITVSSLPSL